MKFTAERSANETFFLETVVYQGTTFSEKMRKSYPWRKDAFETETLQYIHFHLLSPTQLLKRLFDKREAWESYEQTPLRKYSEFKSAWWIEASQTILKEKLLLEVKLTERKAALLKKDNQEEKDWNIAFRDTIPALSVYKKEALMKKWNLIQNQPLPCQNLKEPPKVLFLWERKIMAKDMLVRTKTWEG